MEDEKEDGDAEDEDVVLYDEVDSSRAIDEKIEALILPKPNNLPMDQENVESDQDNVHVVGPNVEQYTGHTFSAQVTTTQWMEWDATSLV